MRMLVFEGTVQEIKELQKEILRSGNQALSIAIPEDPHAQDSSLGLTPGRLFASSDLALRVFTRRPLSREQRLVIAAVYHSHPDGILATDLQKQIGYSPSRFAGLMGALGRRLVNTQGYVDHTWLFDNQWESEHGCNRYRFPDSVREAVERARLA